MELDLRKDYQALKEHLLQRIRDYSKSPNEGPDEEDDPIGLITFGYQFDQAGWAALVFDTRPGAASDGYWQSYIGENALDMEHWFEVSEELCSAEKTVDIICHDGKTKKLLPDDDGQELVDSLGDLLRDLLMEANADGLFDPLPRSDDCGLVIEEHEGQYGWHTRIDGTEM